MRDRRKDRPEMAIVWGVAVALLWVTIMFLLMVLL